MISIVLYELFDFNKIHFQISSSDMHANDFLSKVSLRNSHSFALSMC